MKILLSLIILFIPISIFAKQICLAPSGCQNRNGNRILLPNVFLRRMNQSSKKKRWLWRQKPIVKIPSKKKPSQKVSQSKDRKPRKRERNWVGTLFECIVGCKENIKLLG